MGIVNPTEVHPAIVRSLYRLCVERGRDAAGTIDEYVALLAPDGAVSGGQNPKLSAQRTVREATRFGLLAPCDNGKPERFRLALPPPPEGSSPDEAETFFVHTLRQLVFAPENNEPLFAERTADEDEDEGQGGRGETLATTASREFTRTQAWLLAQDPSEPAFSWSEGKGRRGVQKAKDGGRELVVNDLRWNNFRRWSLYLGLSRQDGQNGVIPDPTRAISEELAAVRDTADEMPVVDFISRLAECLPVLDGGSYRAAVLRHLGRAEPENTVSPALSLALLRMDRSGRARLEEKADFGGGSLTVGPKQATHVVFAEAS